MMKPTLNVVSFTVWLAATSALAQPVSFKGDIAPILLQHCQACHGPKKSEAGYRVDTFERAMAAGDSEIPAFEPHAAKDSEAFRRIASNDEDERMPAEADPLPAAQIALVRRWIEAGAKFDAEDPKASLSSIVPPPMHPDPPEKYPRALPITALVFSPDGKELLAGGYHEITVWNPADGSLLRRIDNEGQRTYSIVFSPDGKLIAAASGTPGRLGEVRLFDAASGEMLKVLGSATDVALDAAFSPDGKRLAMAAADNVIRVLDVASGQQQSTIRSHSDWVSAVTFSADGSLLASASRDKTAKVFQADSGQLVITYAGHEQPVRGVAFHPGGKQVFSSGADKRIHRWNISDGKKTADVASFGGQVYKLHATGDRLAAPSADKTVRLYELNSHKQLRQFAGHKDSVLSVALSPDGQRLASGSFDGEVRVWNTENGEQACSFVAAPGYNKQKP